MSNFEYSSFFLGSLSGPISILSSLCYVALPIYFFSWGSGARWARQFSLESALAIATILLLAVDQLLLHAGRIGILFVIILAVSPALLAKDLRTRIANRPPRKTSKITIVIAVVALMIGSASFQQFRGNRQDAVTQLRGHGAELSSWVDTPARASPFFANYMLQMSYLTTPSPTLGYYLDLPRADTPGPFYGRYNFHVIYRNVFRFLPTFDRDFWAKDRAELFLPLVRYGRGAGNIWATLFRDLMADFGKPGALVALFLLGGAGQAVGDAFRAQPTAAKAALLTILRTVFLFSALLSIFFLTWTVPALLILTAAIVWRGYIEKAPLMARQDNVRRAARV
ncbi:MAG: hypothetical protein Q7T44_00055 [Parvibaculum sp.]|nr:hypothetical protein [Parvibaculum sp.]